MARLVDQGRTRLTWVPGEDGIADITAPTVSELTAPSAVDLTCMMVTTYEVRADGSDTTSERAVCDVANVATPTVANYMGRFDLFRQWDPEQDQWDTQNDPLAFLQYSEVGFFVRRTGLPHDQAYEEGQQVEVYRFMPDHAQINAGTGEGYLKMTVPLLQQGAFELRAVVTSGS